ncbi:hypothetical protein Daus18300_007019 [Diaporthe australafricana]|uniref:Uncharacterized protein n=1 Tax=Diaporthe australafricana TaxID=127596 RepID=A0ABR3WQG7_9PEZI
MPPQGPPSSVYAFDRGYRPGRFDRFLDQVDMGVNVGGLVRVNREELKAKHAEQHHLLARLHHNLDTAELNLKNFLNEDDGREKGRKGLDDLELAREISVEDAYARRDIGTAMGLEMANKNLRIELSVRARVLNQKAMALDKSIQEAEKRTALIKHNIVRAQRRLHELEMKLRPVGGLMDGMNH